MDSIYYFIKRDQIRLFYYVIYICCFNELNKKIKVKILGVLCIINKIIFEMIK